MTPLTDPIQNIAYFFMYVIIQEILIMNVLVSEIKFEYTMNNSLCYYIALCCTEMKS